MLYVAADHAGFALKEKIKAYLVKKRIPLRDLGAQTFEKSDDYPMYAQRLARQVAAEKGALGVILCSTGTGMAIAANRVKGARAVMCQTPECATLAREHNNANIVTFGPLTVSESQAKRVVDAFLKAQFDRAARRVRRVKQLDTLR
ncbi:MAG: RpiB/LacA/LacB family sugar-phosphate isomerase [Candidatus Kerfeldbacteria bacterium]|nr:RpiB/LacA/LacB family sugar-phosphate isomerase [Candidatus Kerfeldbacteria bacterium]